MFDTIGFVVPLEGIRTEVDAISDLLSGQDRIKGKGVSQCFIKAVKDGIFLKVSLPKLLCRTNEQTLPFDGVPFALRQLELEFGLRLEKAKLYQIEIGTTIPVDNPPSQYMVEWGPVSRVRKDSYNSGMTVMYVNNTWSFSGYDKAAEIMATSGIAFRSMFGLRLEYRRKRKLKKLNGYQLAPWDIAHPEVATLLLDTWMEAYRRIPKSGRHAMGIVPRTERQMERELARHAFSILGHDCVQSTLLGGVHANIIKPRAYSRMKNRLVSLAEECHTINPGALSAELDAKVNRWYQAQLESIKCNQKMIDTDTPKHMHREGPAS